MPLFKNFHFVLTQSGAKVKALDKMPKIFPPLRETKQGRSHRSATPKLVIRLCFVFSPNPPKIF
jgi:hypothetical protein